MVMNYDVTNSLSWDSVNYLARRWKLSSSPPGCMPSLLYMILLIKMKGWVFLSVRLYKDITCSQTCLNMALLVLNWGFSNTKNLLIDFDLEVYIHKKRSFLLTFWKAWSLITVKSRPIFLSLLALLLFHGLVFSLKYWHWVSRQ